MKDNTRNTNEIAVNKWPKDNKKIYLIFSLLIIMVLGLFWFILFNKQSSQSINNPLSQVTRKISPSPSPINIPVAKTLSNGGYHIFQSFNNCGPAALSMALKFYGINISQEDLGNSLRPYQIPGGDNDDKSVTLEEVAEKSKEYNLTPYLRPMGNDKLVKQFIAQDIPVITRTWLKADDDIGHYRIIKGYDDNRGVFIQDDSLQGKDLEYTYSNFDEIWKKFNYEYLVLIPDDKITIAEQILGKDLDEKAAWEKAKNNSLNEIKQNPNDVDSIFNLSVAFYKLGDYKKSTEEFEKVENKLSFRTLWYQIDPILAYFELGNDARVFEITDKILNNQNRAFSELYILRGKIYQKQENNQAAKEEFEKAVLYNSNLKEAQELLNSINSN